jgi:hypothetical protein
MEATLDRLIGTVGGAVVGGAVGFVVPHQNEHRSIFRDQTDATESGLGN